LCPHHRQYCARNAHQPEDVGLEQRASLFDENPEEINRLTEEVGSPRATPFASSVE
jgi:hypothetical protein